MGGIGLGRTFCRCWSLPVRGEKGRKWLSLRKAHARKFPLRAALISEIRALCRPPRTEPSSRSKPVIGVEAEKRLAFWCSASFSFLSHCGWNRITFAEERYYQIFVFHLRVSIYLSIHQWLFIIFPLITNMSLYKNYLHLLSAPTLVTKVLWMINRLQLCPLLKHINSWKGLCCDRIVFLYYDKCVLSWINFCTWPLAQACLETKTQDSYKWTITRCATKSTTNKHIASPDNLETCTGIFRSKCKTTANHHPKL